INAVTHNFSEPAPYLDELADAMHSHRRLRRHRGELVIERVRDVSLRGVRYEYAAGLPALDDVNLDLGAGEWLGVVGPSGAGKTTLVNLIAGLLTPTTGDYLVNGQPPRQYDGASWARQLGLLSQEPVL